ncbi:unnamed protein product [Linum tenue]|uniref:Uncharacterized protein n=1 Tax=Linum tenue TaxID=586396 RepID=A0AAV0S2C1_9ROSI|nr:unnamed protein product [Linum tenue]
MASSTASVPGSKAKAKHKNAAETRGDPGWNHGIDLDDFPKTASKVFEMLNDIVEKVGEENVVQNQFPLPTSHCRQSFRDPSSSPASATHLPLRDPSSSPASATHLPLPDSSSPPSVPTPNPPGDGQPATTKTLCRSPPPFSNPATTKTPCRASASPNPLPPAPRPLRLPAPLPRHPLQLFLLLSNAFTSSLTSSLNATGQNPLLLNLPDQATTSPPSPFAQSTPPPDTPPGLESPSRVPAPLSSISRSLLVLGKLSSNPNTQVLDIASNASEAGTPIVSGGDETIGTTSTPNPTSESSNGAAAPAAPTGVMDSGQPTRSNEVNVLDTSGLKSDVWSHFNRILKDGVLKAECIRSSNL